MSITDNTPNSDHYRLGERTYGPAEIADMRAALERETGLSLADMSNRGVVINYAARHPAAGKEES